ncbi:hypothetical protein P691DRAFT_464603 [Macrolepiota fuliginosa MF-IS2]|uniref:F-box domain-containing protein n=1 Tax=Macrolepiota fuliginosa MF-IS2 TaxID=1400762 RepID=A0A9P5X276_9AGAR|nr:hypothetical protein P691DRAFT_464603 [Macrolepiota fuliginosa MF-IS2]
MVLNSAYLRWILYLLFRLLNIPPHSWRRYLTAPKTLLSLPNEVLCEIFHYVDWRGLLAMKFTCRRLYTITRTRSLWHSKIPELSLMPGALVLEDAIETYTVDELEQKVIKVLQARDRLRHPDPSTFRSRVLNVDPETRGVFHLLPGARWLIDNLRGYVYALDLDAPEQTRHILFDVRQYDDWDNRLVDPLDGSAIWIDSSQPRLSIRIAMHNTHTSHRLDLSRICIHQLDLRGHGSDASWTTNTQVKSPSYSYGIIWKVQPLSLYPAIDWPPSPKRTSKFSAWHNLRVPARNRLLSHSSDFRCIPHQFCRYLASIATIDSLSSAQQVRVVSM